MHVSIAQMAPNLRLVTNIDDDVNWLCVICRVACWYAAIS